MESIKIPAGHTARIEGDTITFVPNASEDELREKSISILREATPHLCDESREWVRAVCEWLATPKGQISVLTFSTNQHSVPDRRLIPLGKAILGEKEELFPSDYEGRAGLAEEGWLSNGVKVGKGERFPVIARFDFYGPDFGRYLVLAATPQSALVIKESLCYPAENDTPPQCQSTRPTIAAEEEPPKRQNKVGFVTFFRKDELIFRGNLDTLKPKVQAFLRGRTSLPKDKSPELVTIAVLGETSIGRPILIGTALPKLLTIVGDGEEHFLLRLDHTTALLISADYCTQANPSEIV